MAGKAKSSPFGAYLDAKKRAASGTRPEASRSFPGPAASEAPASPADPVDPVDVVTAYLESHGTTPSKDLIVAVGAQGVSSSDVLDALTRMEKFGLIRQSEEDDQVLIGLR